MVHLYASEDKDAALPTSSSPMIKAAASPFDADMGVGGAGLGAHPGLRRTASSKRGERHSDHADAAGPAFAHTKIHPPPAHAADVLRTRPVMTLTPAEIYEQCAHHGEVKSKMSWLQLIVLTTIAGCYVGFGFTICLMVGGNVGADLLAQRPGLFSLAFGVVGFPAAFTMIVINGAELFTSLCAYMTAAWWEGRVTIGACVRMWVVSWMGNFAGCAIFLGLIYSTDLYEGKDWYTLLLAQKKVHHSFGSALVRGIFANWLVGIATWQANAAQDLAGKAIGIWLPISAFAMLGFEHVIANQFVLPMAIALGAPISAYDVIVKNFIPATLGNWIGGAVCVATVYAFAYGTPNRRVTAFFDRRLSSWRAGRPSLSARVLPA
ncbi:formate nitrite transporter [Raphidocelis subcapitata]|uniref:Formate nitrite transporter n=1 Tax=Raphidocelis subcapitata TaxID=307507 RepID=A0A2V0PGI1_9CHLO|nr:formate nitrite transporter [Raphidocelis subcapitata]|eukprot:GBF98659.1 formate nitrite transporter [Raphidocelis subcapitata]